jgi:hypothetical protein
MRIVEGIAAFFYSLLDVIAFRLTFGRDSDI